MASISIECRTAFFVWDHLYVVYKDDYDNEFVIRGGPENSSAPYGDIVVEVNVPIEESSDARGTASPEDRFAQEVDLGGRSAEDVWSLLTQLVASIGDAELAYDVDDQNSNSTIASALFAVGIDVASTLPVDHDTEDFPGIENLLTFDRELTGTSNGDIIYGYTGADTLAGGDGNDIIEGGAGADVLNGGDDTDTVSYAGSSSAVTVTINGSASGGDAAGDTLSYFENLVGSAYADTLTGDGYANLIVGGAGADLLTGAGGDDIIVLGTLDTAHLDDPEGYGTYDASSVNHVYWSGTSGHDTVVGFKDSTSAYADILHVDGLSAADLGISIDDMTGTITLTNSGATSNKVEIIGNDTMGKGMSWLTFNSTAVFSDGSTLFIQDGTSENISGTSYDDLLVGSDTFDDTFIADAGADWIDGLGGNNTVSYVNSGAGVNVTLDNGSAAILDALGMSISWGTATVGGTTDTLLNIQSVIGSDYNDTIEGSSANNTITGGDGDDTLYGYDGNDTISGGAGADTIYGGDGSDTINGNGGADIIYASLGVDMLTGGVGADSFRFNLSACTGVGSGNRDIITDFSQAQGDVLAFNGELSGLTFIGTKAFSGKAAQIRYSTGGGNTIVAGDTNADGSADFEVQLTGTYTLTGSDFALA